MRYPRVSQVELRATTQKASRMFEGRASKAFQLGSQTAVTVNGILLIHDDDSDCFYLVGRYAPTRDGFADVAAGVVPINSLGVFEAYSQSHA